MQSHDVALFGDLTSQERVVLRRLSQSGTYAEIARELHVSENTIKTHVSHVYAKLGANNRASALTSARALGLLEAEDDSGDRAFVVTTEAARTYFSEVAYALRERDWATYARLHRPDACRISPVSRCFGIDAMIERNQQLQEAVPDRRFELVSLMIDREGNRAIFECVHTGTVMRAFSTPNGMIPATGRRFRFVGVDVVTFDHSGLATEIRRYWDLHEVLRQQGIATI